MLIGNVFAATLTCAWLRWSLHQLIGAMKDLIKRNYHRLARTLHSAESFAEKDEQRLSTLYQYLHLESCLAMQIRSLAHITYPRRTRLSPSTVHQKSKWNQTIDQTAKSFCRPSARRKHSTRCLHELGNGRRLRSTPILVASMLENLESRNPPSNQ